MFLVLQHPFADLRHFVGTPTGRLSRPAWPLVDTNVDFVRSSGLVRRRLRGGVEEWAGEEAYGDASFALRFTDRLGDLALGPAGLQGRARFTFRRFHSEGKVARVEVGFRVSLDATEAESAVAMAWLKLVEQCVHVSTRVRVADGSSKRIALVATGRDLASHFLRASTSRKLLAQPPESWWFPVGRPAIFIESQTTAIPRAPHSLVVFEDPAIGTLSHAWLQFGQYRCSSWWLTCTDSRSADARRLRIHLLRLHAERECLRLLLVAIASGKLAVDSDLAVSDTVQDYLNTTIRLIERPKRDGVVQSPMFEAAQHAIGLAQEGESATYQLMRRQIANKVDRYVRRAEATATIINNVLGDQMNNTIQMGNVSVTGDFNVVTAKNISSSFNKAASAEVDNKLKESLKALTIEVANLVKVLPPDEAETASKNLEVLTSEAVSKKPRKEWYELSAKGLLEAANTVAKMATPITTAVTTVLGLLAG